MTVKIYPEKEERLNKWSHAIGIPIATLGTILLLLRSGTTIEYITSVIYGLSMILLYTASTLYHSSRNPVNRARLRIFDHSAIYVLIAGTYTPFTLLTLPNQIGLVMFYSIWGMALVGIVLKLFFTGRFSLLSTILYVGMSWTIVFAVKPLIANLSTGGLNLLLFGGISYMVGAVFYSIRKLPYHHAIFHVFVLLGTTLHFLSIYHHVI